MPAVAKLGSMCTGHDGYPPRASDAGSPNVFVNGVPVHRQGDHWVSHCKSGSCHDSVLTAGSASVFVNGKAIGRVGDSVACGSKVSTGSTNVFAGG